MTTQLNQETSTLQQLAREAMDVQDACNLSGVVHAFSRSMSALWDLAHSGQLDGFNGTRSINEHPISVMFASKIASLTRCDDIETFGNAYDECDKLVKGDAC